MSIKCAKDTDPVLTSKTYANAINKQIGKYFYATNTPFNHADHVEFKKACSMLRPGYESPSAHQIAGPILNEVYSDILQKCQQKLQGETVSMSLDGWSNVHNEPIVCCSIMTQHGESILVHTVDTSRNSHTALYLKEVAVDAVKATEKNFGVKVKTIKLLKIYF